MATNVRWIASDGSDIRYALRRVSRACWGVQLTVDQYSRMGVPRDSQKLAERQALLVEINRQIEADAKSIHRTITAR